MMKEKKILVLYLTDIGWSVAYRDGAVWHQLNSPTRNTDGEAKKEVE